MHIQNPHKTVGGPLLAALAAALCGYQTAKARSLSVRLLIQQK